MSAQAAQGCVAPPSGRPQEALGDRRPRWMTIPARAGQNSAYRPPRWLRHRPVIGSSRARPRLRGKRAIPAARTRGDHMRRALPATGAGLISLALMAAPVSAQDGGLDRIEMPEEARRRISELVWAGASLIVSDNPRSHELGEYTDFIVLTR